MSFNFLNQRNFQNPDSIFLRIDDKEFTFSEIKRKVDECSTLLVSAGIKKQNKVAILLDDSYEITNTILGCMNIGAIFTPINTKRKKQEIQSLLNVLQPNIVVTTKKQSSSIKSLGLAMLVVDNISKTKDIITTNLTIDKNDICSILFTSGTTGSPKAVQLTYNNFLISAEIWNKNLHFSQSDIYLNCMPLDHIGGVSIVIRALIYGFSVKLTNGFDTQLVNQIIDNDDISLVSLVPTMLQKLIDNRNGVPFPKTLRTILLGGGITSEKLLEYCIEHKLPIFKTYGMTETSSGVAGFYINNYPQKISSVGKPFDKVNVKIVNEEIKIASPTVMKGYLNKPNCKGIHFSGDFGKFDEDGFLYLSNRRADLIVTGGENVNPREVEKVLNSHPKINLSKVVGVYDELWGQKVVAYVVKGSGILARDSELENWCKERLSNFKIPKKFIFVEILPK